jgi:protein phosphatase
MQVFSYSIIGPRKSNEDSYSQLIKDQTGIFCIADGVGGQNCGNVASKFSVEQFIDLLDSSAIFTEMDLERIVLTIHSKVLTIASESKKCKRMATTLSGCVVKGMKLTGVHLGDSRICVLRKNGIKELTIEHSEGARLYREKLLNREQYLNYFRKNIIESAIGIEGKPTIQTFSFDLEKKDRILMSTDGFHNLVTKERLRDLSVANKMCNDFFLALKKILEFEELSDNSTFQVVEV